MDTDYRLSHLSLPYPNPSLGQMAAQEGSDSSDSAVLKTSVMSPPPQPPQPPQPLQPPTTITNTRPGGVRQAALVASLLIGLLFSSLDTSIVSTSLVTISHDFNDFANSPWIVLAYLLTYMGFAVFMSKLSDIYGRRNMLVLSWVIFIGFSLGCGSSKGMVALIICRAFQGIGASGLYSLTQIGLIEVGPVHRPGLIGAMIGATLAVAFVLGPIAGGLISQFSDWRWIFNINIPFGLLTILAITNFWPPEDRSHLLSRDAFTRIDFIGSTALVFGSGSLVFALQQAGSQASAWASPEIIAAFLLSGVSLVSFVCWELFLEAYHFHRIEPIFPIRLILRRIYLAGLLLTFLTGFPYISLTIILPERFQIVNNESVLMAGVRILPLLGACAMGSFLGGALSSKKNNTSYTLIAASCFQMLGVGLLTMVVDVKSSTGAQYAYQAIFGLGVGLSFSGATIMTSILATKQDERASAQGAVAQARVLGGAIGLSICTVMFNSHVNRELKGHLTQTQLGMLHRSPLAGLSLSKDMQELVRAIYAGAFADEVKVMAVICAVMVVVSLLTLEKHPVPLERLTEPSKEDVPSRRDSDSGTELNEIPVV